MARTDERKPKVVSIERAISASPEPRQGDHHDEPQKSLRRIRIFRRHRDRDLRRPRSGGGGHDVPGGSDLTRFGHRDLRRSQRLFPGAVRQPGQGGRTDAGDVRVSQGSTRTRWAWTAGGVLSAAGGIGDKPGGAPGFFFVRGAYLLIRASPRFRLARQPWSIGRGRCLGAKNPAWPFSYSSAGSPHV